MAEGVGESGVKSRKKPQNIKSHHNNIPVNFVNKSGKKDNDKQLANKLHAGIQDSDISQTDISFQRPKHSSQEEQNETNKSTTSVVVRGPSTSNSPHRSKEKQESKRDRTKNDNELVNGCNRIPPNNSRAAEKSKEHEKKVKSKKGKSDSNNKQEARDELDLQQSFQNLIVGNRRQYIADDHNAENSHSDGKEEPISSKKSVKSKERNKEIENQLRKDLQQARNKFWLNYFQKRPTELVVLTFHRMNELQKVDLKQQHAQFKCGVCQYYCNSMAVVTKHIKEDRHNKNIKKLLDNYTVKVIPSLPASHTDVQTEMLENLYTQYGMREDDRTVRQVVVKYIDELVQKELPGCSVRMFGSSVHCLGLKASDLNIDLRVGKNWVASKALCLVAELIKKNSAFCHVKTNFTEKIPTVVFMHGESKVSCVISLNNERPVLLSAFIAKYTPLHPFLPRLTTVFRLWGKLACVDQQDKGLWPAYALYLLVIFFLQHCHEPVLPVLNDFVGEAASENPSQSDLNENVLKLDTDEVKSKWQSKNTQTLGELWVNLLKFYASNCDSPDYVVSIDGSEPKFRQPKRINIVDPFMPKRNVTRTVTCASLYNYIAHCLKTTYRYFGVPQTQQGPIFGSIAEELTPPEKYLHHKDVFVAHNSMTSQFIRMIPLIDKNYLLNDITEDEAYKKVTKMLNTKHQSYMNLSNVNIKLIERAYPNEGQYKNLIVSPQDANYLIYQLDPTALEYRFNRCTFTADVAMPLVCEVCKEEGHIKDECPAEELSALEPLPPVDKKMLLWLDALCAEVYDKWIPDAWELRKRDEIVQLLQQYISSIYPTAVLTLFGSSKNGFGSKRSDLDVCLTFNEEDARKGLKAPVFIEKLGAQLKKCPGLKNLLIISSAKVPIIKFEHTESKLEGDISLYNILGQENTQLLRSYTEIDNRVTPLGFMMKKFAKHCHIGDASKGGLSSYAYSLMVIYFLQHCSPPVLPVLQELHEGDGPCPEVYIDGCNTYYYKDIHKLNEVWKDRQKNTYSVGHLWLQLLRFYTEIFDIENHVISIRTFKPVTKFEKLWISKCIAIEDPFDVAHNLGSALSRNMNIFIIKALRKGRKIFGTPIHYIPNHTNSIQAIYFNTAEFQDTSPPNDRGCRFCKTIGHIVRDCPTKKAIAERKNPQKKHKKSKESAATSAEDSKETEISLGTSGSDSESEKDSAESIGDKMSLSKAFKHVEDDNPPMEKTPHLKLKSTKADYFQPAVDNVHLGMTSHLKLKLKSMKADSKNNHGQQHHLVGIPLMKTGTIQPVPQNASSNNNVQEKYFEDIARTYGVPYHGIMHSKGMQNSSLPAGNHDSGELLPIQTKPVAESEGDIFKKGVEIPKTLVYTNSNFKNECQNMGLFPPTHTASSQIPSSIVYTNSNYRNDRGVPGASPPTERDLNREVMRSLTEMHQQQRFAPARTPPLLGNPNCCASVNELHSHQYETVGNSVHLIPPVIRPSSSSAPTVSPTLLSPPPLSSVPRLGSGHPGATVHRMTPPVLSVPHVASIPSVNNSCRPGFPVFDRYYPFFNSPQGPQATSAVTSRNVHTAKALHSSAQIYEDSHRTMTLNRASLHNPVSANIGDLSSNVDFDRSLPPFSFFTIPNSVPVAPQSGRNFNNRNRNKTEFEQSELQQLDKRAKHLTKTGECRADQTSQLYASSSTSDGAHTSAKRVQKEKRHYKRGRKISKKHMGGEDKGESKHTVTEEKPVSTDSNSSDS